MTDYELQLKIRNAPMLQAMRACGMRTAADLSRASGISQGSIGRHLALSEPLYRFNSGGERVVKPSIEAIAKALGCEPHDLYPETHWYSPLEQNTFTAQVSRDQLQQLAHSSTQDPALLLEQLEESFEFDDLVSALTEREQLVLRRHFVDGAPFAEIGQDLGVSLERARQIKEKALRKLRGLTTKNSTINEKLRDTLAALNRGDHCLA